ncbi:MAG: hypothetical protein HYZ22_14025 [Chloroflexi bacterium]|nr:hypothetical protein [Chloroflexota bacterium]
MTVVVAWTRKLTDRCEELLIATDSRLSGGRNIDCSPKVLPLSRSDCAICFAGDTDFAYPMMLQFVLAIDSYRPSRTRGLDFTEIRSHALKVFDAMANKVYTPIPDMKIPDVSFLLGGYSWIHKRFELWKIKYNKGEKRFEFENSKRLKKFGKILFAGDRAKDLRNRLITRLRNDENNRTASQTPREVNMEPFEVLRDLLRETKNSDSIGGPPQLLKVYQHINALPVPVFWPSRESNKITLLGRPLLGYERPDNWILDPDTLETVNPLDVPNTK